MVWFGVFYCLWVPLMLKKKNLSCSKVSSSKMSDLGHFLGISALGTGHPWGKASQEKQDSNPSLASLAQSRRWGCAVGASREFQQILGNAVAGLEQGFASSCPGFRLDARQQFPSPSSHSRSKVSPAGPFSPHRPLVFLWLAGEKQQNAQRDGKISFYINIAIKQGFILSP